MAIVDMKFDVCLMNPPFSKIRKGGAGLNKAGTTNKENVFQDFYAWAINHATNVACVMPTTSIHQQHKNLQKHNQLIETIARDILPIKSGTFPVECWCVISDENSTGCTIQDTFEGPKDRLPLINWRRGRANSANINRKQIKGELPLQEGVSFEEQPNYVKVYQRVKNGKLIHHWADPKIHSQPRMKAGTTHVVITGCGFKMLDHKSIQIIEWKKELFNANIFFIQCHSFEEAKETQQWLCSDEFKDIYDKKSPINVTSLQKLPNYK